MEKRKPRTSNTDVELSLVKAAAWAWYEHGSGSDGKPMSEFDLTRFNNSPNPSSRYKLQAIKQLQDQTRCVSSAGCSLLGDSSSNSLLDKFEIERISKQLDLYIESAHHASQRYADDGSTTMAAVGQSGCGLRKKNSKHKKKLKEMSQGFFLFRHSAICGSRNDLVENRSLRHVRLINKKLMN